VDEGEAVTYHNLLAVLLLVAFLVVWWTLVAPAFRDDLFGSVIVLAGGVLGTYWLLLGVCLQAVLEPDGRLTFRWLLRRRETSVRSVRQVKMLRGVGRKQLQGHIHGGLRDGARVEGWPRVGQRHSDTQPSHRIG
jgi:hypothetical protein